MRIKAKPGSTVLCVTPAELRLVANHLESLDRRPHPEGTSACLVLEFEGQELVIQYNKGPFGQSLPFIEGPVEGELDITRN